MVQGPPYGTADEEERKTRPGAVVWAKVTGFPWWPATLGCVPASKPKRDTDIWVQFFNDNQGAWVAPSALRLMTDEMTSYLAPVIKPSSKYYNEFVVALQQAQASIPEATPPTRDGGSTGRAGRDAAGAAANGGTAPASSPPSGGGGGSSRGSKSHARKWGSLAGGRGIDASPPSATRARRPSPPTAGATGRGGTAHRTPVTPAKSGGSVAGAGDDAERPRKRAKATPARSAARATAPSPGEGGGRRKVGPSRRGLQSALVAAQAELSVLRECLATAEAAATAVIQPLTWEGIKGALKRFDLHSELPTAALGAGARVRDRRATVRDGAAGDDAAKVDRYEVPKAQRMVKSVTTEELKEAVDAISLAGKRIGAAAGAADQQRAVFQAVLDAIPLRGAAAPAAEGALPAASAAAASVPPPTADAGVAAANSSAPSRGRTVRDAAGATTVGGVPPPAPTAAGGTIPAEVAEAAHVVAFADQFKEWAALRAERHAAEDALEAAVRRVMAMKVTLMQLSESQAGKPVRITFQRYYKISPAVDMMCTALIDQWMEFISQATMQDLSVGTLAKPRPSAAAPPPPEAGAAAVTPGPPQQAEDVRRLPPRAEAEAGGGRQAGTAPPRDDALGGKAGGAPNMAVVPPATADAEAGVQVAVTDSQADPPPAVAAAPSVTAAPVPPSPTEPAAAAAAVGTATHHGAGGAGADAPAGGGASREGHPLDGGHATDRVAAMVP
ncbi:hypothetical protein MMPV_000325 [Pyropia vietnamensis]